MRSRGHLLNVSVNDQSEICDIRNVLHKPGVRNCQFTGIYAIETSILNHMVAGKIESIVSVFLERISASPGSVLGVFIDEGTWQDIGSVEIYEALKKQADTMEGQ